MDRLLEGVLLKHFRKVYEERKIQNDTERVHKLRYVIPHNPIYVKHMHSIRTLWVYSLNQCGISYYKPWNV